MGSRFGFHSGNFHAKNMVAGSFILSGATTSKAITFAGNRRFKKAPYVQLQQKLFHQHVSGGGTSSYIREYSTAMSGVLLYSGATTSGFTFVTDYAFGLSGAIASGAWIEYLAFDFQDKYK